MSMNSDEIKRTAIAAAYKGSKIISGYFGRFFQINKKGAIDLVTQADLASERLIIKTIRSKFPDHMILAEESGFTGGTSKYKWIIDPLDGTTNFAHGLGIVSISIAFLADDEIQVGIVLNPFTGELFTAIKGRGANLNGSPIRVSNNSRISDSLLVTGFPYDFKDRRKIFKRFVSCLKASQGVRRLGSAALDLCFVACGRFDGFWEENLKPWDTAAGVLIAKEAGAIVTDFSGGDFSIEKKEILATNGKIHKKMISLLK